MTAATTNWGIYSNGVNTQSYLAGNTLFGTLTARGQTTVESPGGSKVALALSNTDTGSSQQVVVSFLRNGTGVGSITNTSSGTQFNTTSDKRVKENIQPITNAGAIIDLISPVKYNFKASYDPFQSPGSGFLAQDLYQVIPEAVLQGDANANNAPGQPGFKMWAVDYSRVVPYTVADLKALHATIATMQAEIVALKAHDGIQ